MSSENTETLEMENTQVAPTPSKRKKVLITIFFLAFFGMLGLCFYEVFRVSVSVGIILLLLWLDSGFKNARLTKVDAKSNVNFNLLA